MKEATARIKINKLLESAGWRFLEDENGPANVQLEYSVTLKSSELDALGNDFEKASKGSVDFLLLSEGGYPLAVLEAKSEKKNPLAGKEQARKYAKSQNCRFIILSNGVLHYFWDLERGEPHFISVFPGPGAIEGYKKSSPNPDKLVVEIVNDDYIALTQYPAYSKEIAWLNPEERPDFIAKNGLRFLRHYQEKAIFAIQHAVKSGKDRFLLEMATGTGKTLNSAAIIKLFLRTGNATRVLFLVDRLELEVQAQAAFEKLLKNDYKSVIYKESRDEWRHAEIVVTTVQSLLFNNKYQRKFSPTDFDLVISDEAHRSIGGNARAVFDYFVGYKLGLTATPKDYLKKFDKGKPTTDDPREFERRTLLDTYRTFGCADGQPTFRYSLIDGVKDGFLINPTVVDARSDVTTTLISKEGYVVEYKDHKGEDKKEIYRLRQFERKFFSRGTNALFCKVFLENALRDPISGEIGKSIVFAVSQNHASRLTALLNTIAGKMFPGKYQSDFAVQVTSQIDSAQQFTKNFANNNLLGSANFIPGYKTSKARVCVTVGMMTTGYDCPDILNLGLFRPIFSPSEFIQIKGRGTRKHNFLQELFDESIKASVNAPEKTSYKLFDFFANCEYFETEFKYDQVLKLPKPSGDDDGEGGGGGGGDGKRSYEKTGEDILTTIKEETIDEQGMKVDRMFFQRFENVVLENEFIAASVEAGQWDRVIDYVNEKVFDKPSEFYSLDRLRQAAAVDRRLTLREILEKIFGLIPRFKSMDELLEEEFTKFVADHKPTEITAIPALKNYFKAYATSDRIRHIIDSGELTDLATNPIFSITDFRAVPMYYRRLIPDYIKDYVTLNQFAV